MYWDRETGKYSREKIYGGFFLKTLYGKSLISHLFSSIILPFFAHMPFFSKMYGWFQKTSFSRKRIAPFVRKFAIDTSEFTTPVSDFRSFNDFFIRELRPGTRPLEKGEDVAILPADGRYLVFPNVSHAEGFYIKGQWFNMRHLLREPSLVEMYAGGSLVIARLSPTDCHRFHFPCMGTPSRAKQINGPLYSVSRLALRRRIAILSENRRMLTRIKTEAFGDLLYIEIGATFVGSIRQLYLPHTLHQKGDAKGFFEFGGSCILLLFTPGSIAFARDLIDLSAKRIEVRGKMGQLLGHANRSP